MSYLKTEAITTRVREVLEASAGIFRRVPAGRFSGDLPEGLALDEELRRALENPRVVAHFTRVARSPASPPIMGDVLLYDLDLEVRIIRTVTTLEQLDGDALDLLHSRAFEDVDVVRQALEFPGNLTATDGGDVTDLVSGMCRFVESNVATVKRLIDEGAQQVETMIKFTAVAIARPAVA